MKSKVLLTTGFVFIALLVAAQSPGERLQQLVGNWIATESTFSDPPQGETAVVAAAGGNAIYSTLTFGSGDTYYEANLILELHDPDTKELLEYRAMSWTEDTWKMTARFMVNGEEINHHYTLTRVKE